MSLRIKIAGLEHIDPCQYPAILAALGQHLGFDPLPLLKASSSGFEGDDPRFPKLVRLIELARADWSRWQEKLIKAVLDLLEAGKLFPMTRENEVALHQLFRDHEAALVVRFAGKGGMPSGAYQRLLASGLVTADLRWPSWLETSYRLGAGLDHLKALAEEPPNRAAVGVLVNEAMRVKLRPEDSAALDYVTRRGEVYMRRPAVQATGEVYRVLNEAQRRLTPAETGILREVTRHAAEKWEPAKKLAADLRDAVQGNASLTNDMDRVARTELTFAHAHGSYATLKTQAKGAGMPDPEVYKLVRPAACADCRRIWGLPSAPIPYKLSFIEQREAAGGNFRLPHAQWGPVIGPVHANCSEGSLLLYDPRIVAGINALASRIRKP